VALADRWEAVVLDLDGVLYRGDRAVPGAPEAVRALRERGKRLVFLTNNSARTPAQVARKLGDVGIEAEPVEVVTSAAPTAEFVARESKGEPATAYVVGQEGIREALEEVGVEVVGGDPDAAGFVVVGWDGGVTYDELRVAAVLVRRGARLVATNDDAAYPAPGGELWPGAGAILAAVETASGQQATVVGKPHRPLFEAALDRAGTRSAVMVGDRIETDIAGAAAAGLDAVLVLSGAAEPAHVLDQPFLPGAILDDVGELLGDGPWAPPRPAEDDDMDTVAKLLAGAGLEPEGSTGPEAAVVAGDDDVVASAAADVEGPDAHLRSVVVRDDLRGRHVGLLVSAAAVRRAADRGAEVAWLLTETAERFFRRLGFERVAREEVPAWILARNRQCADSAAAMRRELVQ
jgi:phosphoglycolate/pyridoxal phosphate phosphatase family enzyme